MLALKTGSVTETGEGIRKTAIRKPTWALNGRNE